jgi:hypothetical protein
VSGARIALQSPAASLQNVSDPTGAFRFDLSAPGDYSLSAEREGYFQVKDRMIQLRDGANEVTLVLNPVREQFESVRVSASPPGIDFDKTVSEQVLTGADILEAPYPTTHSPRNAMRLLPMRSGFGGALHQRRRTGAGALHTRRVQPQRSAHRPPRKPVEVEAVRSLEVSSGRSRGIRKDRRLPWPSRRIPVMTSCATRYNFVPGVASHKGLVLQDWTPRFGLSGPIAKGRAWFSDSADAQYTRHVIEELPRGRDRTASWNLSNLLHTQVNLTPSNIFYTGFLLNYSYAPRSGLSVLDPPSTTIDRRARQWFLHFKVKSISAMQACGIRSPQPDVRAGDPARLSPDPDGKSGNYYVDSMRGSRHQFRPTCSSRVPLARPHQIKVSLFVSTACITGRMSSAAAIKFPRGWYAGE